MGYELFAPEILTAALGLLVLALGLLLPGRGGNFSGYVTVVGLAAILTIVVVNFSKEATFFDGIYQIDMYSNFFKILFLTAAVLIFFMASRYTEFFQQRKNEWFSFMIFATVGMMIMVSAGDLLTLFRRIGADDDKLLYSQRLFAE